MYCSKWEWTNEHIMNMFNVYYVVDVQDGTNSFYSDIQKERIKKKWKKKQQNEIDCSHFNTWPDREKSKKQTRTKNSSSSSTTTTRKVNSILRSFWKKKNHQYELKWYFMPNKQNIILKLILPSKHSLHFVLALIPFQIELFLRFCCAEWVRERERKQSACCLRVWVSSLFSSQFFFSF